MRQTGGLAVGAISTRSSPAVSAAANASFVARTPIWLPSASITLTCGTLIIRFILTVSLAIKFTPSWFSSASVRRDARPVFGLYDCEELVNRHDRQRRAAPQSWGDLPCFGFLVANDELIRYLLELGFAYLEAQPLVPYVKLGPYALGAKLPVDFSCVLVGPLGDRQYHGLNPREPDRGSTGAM